MAKLVFGIGWLVLSVLLVLMLLRPGYGWIWQESARWSRRCAPRRFWGQAER